MKALLGILLLATPALAVPVSPQDVCDGLSKGIAIEGAYSIAPHWAVNPDKSGFDCASEATIASRRAAKLAFLASGTATTVTGVYVDLVVRERGTRKDGLRQMRSALQAALRNLGLSEPVEMATWFANPGDATLRIGEWQMQLRHLTAKPREGRAESFAVNLVFQATRK